MTATYTRTHVYVEFANPFLVCKQCRRPVKVWHNNDKCGCDESCWLEPCEHNAEAVDTCPSWSPVDGCTCQEVLGSVDHAPAPPKEEVKSYLQEQGERAKNMPNTCCEGRSGLHTTGCPEHQPAPPKETV